MHIFFVTLDKLLRLGKKINEFILFYSRLFVTLHRKEYKNMKQRIRITDIALKAGVSAGTVDRVLHNRPGVSAKARKLIEQALSETNYKPNAYASALAQNRVYTFVMVLPRHSEETYWDEIEEGAQQAVEARHDFGIDVKRLYYTRFDNASFAECSRECLALNPDGVVVAPSTLNNTRMLADGLHENDIPFVVLDSYMPDLRPLSFYGQDPVQSGHFAARMLMLLATGETEIMLFKQTKDGQVTSKQQANREVGFRHYMGEHFPAVKIVELDVPYEASKRETEKLIDAFFEQHKGIHNGIAFNSKAHIVGDYLLRRNKREVQIMGYDMVPKNEFCLRQGSISFLIAQHSFMQGYNSVDALFRAVVLKKKVEPVNYMPIELLTRENVDFYRRTQL